MGVKTKFGGVFFFLPTLGLGAGKNGGKKKTANNLFSFGTWDLGKKPRSVVA